MIGAAMGLSAKKFAVVALGTALPALIVVLLARRRRLRITTAGIAHPSLPAALVKALRAYESVAILGSDVLGGCTLEEILQFIVNDPQGSGAATDATAVEDARCKLGLEGLTLEETEALVGDVCAAFGRDTVWRRAKSLRQTRGTPKYLAVGGGKRGTCVLNALTTVPFTALLSYDWSEKLEEHFPHRVGRNFGGFVTVLSKPRVDAPPGRSRPLLLLWPCITAPRKVALGEGLEALPTSHVDSERALEETSVYMVFLRDLFQSKVATFLGWPVLPPDGHVGKALRQAWAAVKVRDSTRSEPIAYALAVDVNDAVCEQCMVECGLHVISCAGTGPSMSQLEAALRALGSACKASDEMPCR